MAPPQKHHRTVCCWPTGWSHDAFIANLATRRRVDNQACVSLMMDNEFMDRFSDLDEHDTQLFMDALLLETHIVCLVIDDECSHDNDHAEVTKHDWTKLDQFYDSLGASSSLTKIQMTLCDAFDPRINHTDILRHFARIKSIRVYAQDDAPDERIQELAMALAGHGSLATVELHLPMRVLSSVLPLVGAMPALTAVTIYARLIDPMTINAAQAIAACLLRDTPINVT